MPKRIDPNPEAFSRLIGLGEKSVRKSYYPELKKRMEDLKRFQILLDNAQDAIFLIDAQSREFVWVNRAAMTLTDCEQHQTSGMRIEDVFDDTTTEMLNEFLEGSSDNPNLVFLSTLQGEDGTVYLETTASLHTLDNRTYAVALLRDVTDRKRAEDALRKSEQRFRVTTEMTGTMIYDYDISSGEIVWSGAIRDLTGYAPEDFDVTDIKGWENLIHEDDRKDILEEMDRSIRNNQPFIVTYRFRQKDGSYIFVEDNGNFVFNEAGEAERMLGAMKNVSERHRTQELLIQTEKMMSVGGLAAGMAHEINNPLGIIIQAGQSIFRRFSSDIPANQKTAQRLGLDLAKVREYMAEREIDLYLNGIMDAGKRAGKIVRNMLDFSRRSESRKAAHDINQIIQKSLNLASSEYDLKKRFDFRKINIELELTPDLPQVCITETEIEQVLLNLIKNAAHAMHEKTYSNGEVPTIRIKTGQDQNDQIFIRLTDNGPGMDENTRKRIFEPFFTTKPVGTGTGLGLSVSYFIITRNHGGQIRTESRQGKGTTFTILLPSSMQDCALDA